MDKQKQFRRQNKYVADNYDRFTATFPKGKKEEYKFAYQKQLAKKEVELELYKKKLEAEKETYKKQLEEEKAKN